ncbi:MAG: metallophosphoesterase family protein [Promethearchaeota archaeon]
MAWPDLLGSPKYTRYEHTLSLDITPDFARRIILISDTHISSGINSSFNSTMFRKGLEEISAIKNVDYIIHLGDLTHDGTYLEYQIALDMIRKINNEKFFIIPGNHDSRNVGYRLFEELIGKRTFEIDDPYLYVLGVDSSIPDQNTGRISYPAIKRSEKAFESHDDKVKIFAFHHQLIPIPFTGRERSAIYDAGDVLDMALRKNVDIILNGHRHITNAYSCTDGDSDLVIFNSGTLSANKTRYRELFTYTVLDIENSRAKFITKKLMDGTYVERWRYIRQKFRTTCLDQPYRAANNSGCKKPLVRLVHAGNVHFGQLSFLSGIYEHAARQINEYKPDLFIITGSVTETNKPDEYDLANRLLPKIECPRIVLPGFHDLTKYGWNRFSEKIGPEDPTFESENVRVIGINTVDHHLSNGAVGRKRMHDTCDYFREGQADKPKFNVIAMNHRLLPSPKLKFEDILEDSGSVLKNFTDPANHIDLILMGKNNIGFTLQLEETVLSFSGSLSSLRSVNPQNHSFNIIETYANGCIRVYEHSIEQNQSRILGQFWH